MDNDTPINNRFSGIAFVSCYVDDLEKAIDFYVNLLGFSKAFDMGENAVFLSVTEDLGLYLQGKCDLVSVGPNSVRSTFTFQVKSAGKLFELLKSAGVETVESSPMKMDDTNYWFQFRDPAGNFLEVLGQE